LLINRQLERCESDARGMDDSEMLRQKACRFVDRASFLTVSVNLLEGGLIEV
jgi:hypothetical protein